MNWPWAGLEYVCLPHCLLFSVICCQGNCFKVVFTHKCIAARACRWTLWTWSASRTPRTWCALPIQVVGHHYDCALHFLLVGQTWSLELVSHRMHASPQTSWIAFTHWQVGHKQVRQRSGTVSWVLRHWNVINWVSTKQHEFSGETKRTVGRPQVNRIINQFINQSINLFIH